MACCDRRARVENGIDRFTLRFSDQRREQGFAHARKAELCRSMVRMMAASGTVCVITSLIVYRFWDDDQYPTTEARELSRWRMISFLGMFVYLIVALGVGRLLAERNVAGTLGLEILIVSTLMCFVIMMAVLLPKHYLARAFGYDDTEAVWRVNLCGTDGNVVLYIDCVVTALHLLMPIRWVVLVPVEVTAVLAYSVPALLLGSPTMTVVPSNIIGLLVLTALAAIGRRGIERQERALFAGLLAEKQMRFQAEFMLSRMDSGGGAAARAEDERSAAASLPPTTVSAAAFDGSMGQASLDQIRAIGQREQWLIASDEVEVLTDSVLGEGAFGVVLSALYHNTLVAVKSPKEDIGMSSRLPELSNELRVLRRVRHPNIAFFYGACMDAALMKLSLVLEFVDGVPLGRFVRGSSRGRPGGQGAPEARVLASSASARSLIVLDILNVLRYLHSRQPVVVHGDLKESNVVVEERRGRSGRRSCRAKVLDFGLSRIVTRNAKKLGGTLRWMAPELCSHQAVPPDAAADCYSFGLLAYFIATGCLPFEGESKDQVVSWLSRGKPPTLVWPALADELAQASRSVVEQCTQSKPALRPSAQQASDELSMNQAVGGAMETLLESLGTESSGSPMKRKSHGINAASTVDTSVGNDLQELEGAAEVRQADGASVGPVAPGMDSRMSAVPKHDVLLAGQATGCVAAAAPPSSPERAREQLAHPEYSPTPMSTQTLSLTYLLMQWNVSMPGSACCWLHGALHSLDKVRDELSRRPCNVQQAGVACGQCDECGLLMMQGQSSCEFCEGPSSSELYMSTLGIVDAPTHTEDTISV